jgi:hypothetical protein
VAILDLPLLLCGDGRVVVAAELDHELARQVATVVHLQQVVGEELEALEDQLREPQRRAIDTSEGALVALDRRPQMCLWM